MQENDAWFQCEDGTCPKWSKLFLENLDEASILNGTKLNSAAEQKQHMIDAGFVDVQDVIFKVCPAGSTTGTDINIEAYDVFFIFHH